MFPSASYDSRFEAYLYSSEYNKNTFSRVSVINEVRSLPKIMLGSDLTSFVT